MEVQQRMELNEIQECVGQLLGFQDFIAPIYKNKVNQRTAISAKTFDYAEFHPAQARLLREAESNGK